MLFRSGELRGSMEVRVRNPNDFSVKVGLRSDGKGKDTGPLLLQDHSGFKGAPNTTMRFRNIWIRELK